MPLKLQSIKKANDGVKKYKATFTDDERTYSVKFGQLGYTDYLLSKDKERRERYLERHKANENWNKPDTPGSLSRHLLWGPTTSLQKNIELFKEKFTL
jgi:hypothetical protein